jgi:hypothetical protein
MCKCGTLFGRNGAGSFSYSFHLRSASVSNIMGLPGERDDIHGSVRADRRVGLLINNQRSPRRSNTAVEPLAMPCEGSLWTSCVVSVHCQPHLLKYHSLTNRHAQGACFRWLGQLRLECACRQPAQGGGRPARVTPQPHRSFNLSPKTLQCLLLTLCAPPFAIFLWVSLFSTYSHCYRLSTTYPSSTPPPAARCQIGQPVLLPAPKDTRQSCCCDTFAHYELYSSLIACASLTTTY